MTHDILLALVLGFVEGVTEFLPVSSTGHMILVGHALGFTGPRAETFEIFIQLGAILAVVYLYRERFAALLPGREGQEVRPGGLSGLPGIIKIVAACVPVFVAGAVFHGPIKEHLFGPVTVAAALVTGGILMLLVDRPGVPRRVEAVDDLTLRDAFLIGCFQCLALWPGMSRSGSTMIGGLLIGVARRPAAEFSFLVAVPVMFVAVGADLVKSFASLSSDDLQLFVTGFVTAFVVAVGAVKSFIAVIGRFTLRGFGAYRIVLGVLVLRYYGVI